MRKHLGRPAGRHYETTLRNNSEWSDHVLRTEITADLIAWLNQRSLIDPAAGDGSIVAAAHRRNRLVRVDVGDISIPNCSQMSDMVASGALPYGTTVACRPAMDSLLQGYNYDIVVLTEFLEHVEDPVELLRVARQAGTYLVASSPLWLKEDDDPNPEHLWQFDQAGYEELLRLGGWDPQVAVPVHFMAGMYNFQIWVAK